MSLPSQHSTRLEQPGAEIMVPVTRFWERYGRLALGVLAGLAVVGAVVYFSLRSRQAAEEAAAGKLAEASLYYWQGDYQRSLQLAREAAERYGSTPSGLDAHRQAADAAYWGGDFKTAVAEYRRYLAKNPSGLLADAAHRSLAYALESDRQYLDATREYEALVGHFDRGSSAEFLLAAARCLTAANQPREALARLQRLVNEFGETEYANQARIELAELQAARPGSATP
ncbi:MAG: tetratricopeptide repeat protein [Candidatus Eisenbacteria bacterium]|mgnify:CR=1 FL=1